MITSIKKFIARFLIAFGISCFVVTIILINQSITPKQRATSAIYTTTSPYSQPVEIIIDDLHINLPIYPATIHEGAWQTTTEGASYLTSSPIPGEKGNSVLYAHNWRSLFGNLVYAKPGEKVQVVFNNNQRKTFTILYTSIVSANQIHITDPSQDTRITLYTCTGFLDSQRFVAVALLNKE